MQLTQHFTLEELTQSDTAVRMGIDNTPPAGVVERIRSVLAPGMEQLREILGGVPILPSSGYRCEALERVICDKDFRARCRNMGVAADDAAWARYFARKAHPQGYSLDWTAPKFGPPIAIVRKIAASGLVFDQCIQEGTWVHTSFAPTMRRQVMTAHFNEAGEATYTSGA